MNKNEIAWKTIIAYVPMSNCIEELVEDDSVISRRMRSPLGELPLWIPQAPSGRWSIHFRANAWLYADDIFL